MKSLDYKPVQNLYVNQIKTMNTNVNITAKRFYSSSLIYPVSYNYNNNGMIRLVLTIIVFKERKKHILLYAGVSRASKTFLFSYGWLVIALSLTAVRMM